MQYILTEVGGCGGNGGGELEWMRQRCITDSVCKCGALDDEAVEFGLLRILLDLCRSIPQRPYQISVENGNIQRKSEIVDDDESREGVDQGIYSKIREDGFMLFKNFM
nr:brefeldin A-inhibited guanine nucleotide-exchange protein 1 [Ipomoea batatas]